MRFLPFAATLTVCAGGDASQGRDSNTMVIAKEDSLPDDEVHAAFVRLQPPSQAPLPTGDRSHPHGRNNMHPLLPFVAYVTHLGTRLLLIVPQTTL